MPIINYTKKYEQARRNFYGKARVSDQNKALVSRFEKAYDVKDSTKSIFFTHISSFLEKVPVNLESTFNDRDLVNKIFSEIRKEHGKSTATITKVALKLVTWLNDGNKPKAYKDIKNDTKRRNKRELKPSDMITWEDAKEMIQHSNSVQVQTMLMTQLDAGLRPSEFVDLSYGDVEIKDDLVILHVGGKTGKRAVICHRCVPYFLRWYGQHPTKKRNDPLWIMESVKRSRADDTTKIQRYKYPAIKKRIVFMAKKAKIEKPMDFYNLRHSSCVLDKKDNLPTELAADRHGHSVEFFTKTYGRLSVEDVANRFRTHYGNGESKIEKIENVICQRCQHVNAPETEFCEGCGVVVNLETAIKINKQRDSELLGVIKDLSFRLSTMEKTIAKKHGENAIKKELEIRSSQLL